MADLAAAIRGAATRPSKAAVDTEVRAYLDRTYSNLSSLAGPSKLGRTLSQDVEYWRAQEADATAKLEAAEAALPGAIDAAKDALNRVLERAQALTLERYSLSDEVGRLMSELDSSVIIDDEETERRGPTLLERVEAIHAVIARSRAALAWASVLERVLVQRDTVLDPAGHKPSALAAIPLFRRLNSSVAELESTLPSGMALGRVLRTVRDDTWAQLKDLMSATLVSASEPLKWPLRVEYASVPAAERRAFERAYADLLALQAEGERLGLTTPQSEPAWASGAGLYPIQALVRPIELRFRYHFMGKRNTNRVDKPEWAFASITDMVFEHAGFIADYLQPLTARGGYGSVDVTAELTMLLFPILLTFLRTRMPHLVSHPALLAHTVYQTVLFDDAVREGGFDLSRTSIYCGLEAEWDGLASVILGEGDWFNQWLAGEKRFAETQLHEIISSPTAWIISDTRDDEDDLTVPATESARQVRALLESITDRYSPLPSLESRVAFVRIVQLPLLAAYHARVAGSLEAFETLSSAFVRAVPGALGQRAPDSRLTGTAGLERLLKAYVSADYVLAALRAWSDDILFVAMSADLAPDNPAPPSVWEGTVQKYTALRARAEDMVVRLASSEVETDLRDHLTRRWDVGLEDGPDAPDPDTESSSSLVSALTSYTSLLRLCAGALPRPALARVYRRITSHLVNHIAQRAVYAGWSKFTAAGGRALASEVGDWRAAARLALPGTKTDAAWSKLAEMAAVLSLPSGGGGESASFAQAMAAAWGAPAALENLTRRIGVEMGAEEMQGLLQRRVECWR
ncbi:hypothetical protein CC85DRAFT_270800 [Cutaneotrichosporon oleaginosum]|uniref:RINT-1 family protein n=1 Tax=Cutaneotrichosporon oleaginosum TaxID=879819 RepID=A0A0J0XUP8_9TREE|nr:uncharacterized protein CC85DRAFT_270800 [Cutaneotrichosporon oleaginosum]KLT44777.1 hypothetical protein CC85DRAFT_270800 [Cutaneotrichosporon oleaginosum]TXT07762.1 hypothetical protein COLE_04686 [Cutaneotrichosporon oleaginosum]